MGTLAEVLGSPRETDLDALLESEGFELVDSEDSVLRLYRRGDDHKVELVVRADKSGLELLGNTSSVVYQGYSISPSLESHFNEAINKYSLYLDLGDLKEYPVCGSLVGGMFGLSAGGVGGAIIGGIVGYLFGVGVNYFKDSLFLRDFRNHHVGVHRNGTGPVYSMVSFIPTRHT